MEGTLTTLSPAELIIQTVQKTGNVTDLKELLAIQKDWEANEARKAFASAFAVVQKNIESVVKTKTNAQTKSKYAELSDIIESSKPIYTQEGFSILFYEGDCPKENHIRIFVDILHAKGHKENYHYDVPMDGKGLRGNDNMTAIHGKASSVSYGRRYLMCMIWNIPTADDDGNSTSQPILITDKQLSQLRDILAVKEVSETNIKKLMEYLKYDSLEELPATDFNKALLAINAIPKAGAK